MRPDCEWCQRGDHHFHASDLGKCPLATVAEHLGHEPAPHDQATLLRFAEGKLHERDVVEVRLPAEGYVVTDTQTERVLEVAGIPILTHVDGRLRYGEEPGVLNPTRVLEVKAPSKAEYNKWIVTGWDTPGLWQQYKWAVSCYMLAWGEELSMVVKCRETGRMDGPSIRELPFYTLDEIAERVKYLEDHIARQVLPDTCPHDFFCGFKTWCPTNSQAVHPKDGTPTSSLPTLEVDTTTQLALSQYYLLGEKIKGLLGPVAAEVKALEKARDELKPLLKEGLATIAPNTKYGSGDYEITWVEQPVSASIRRFAKITKKEN